MSILLSVPDVPPADSKIWGTGELLEKIQCQHVFEDSKIFVDLKLLYPAEEIIKRFKELPKDATRDQLKKFVLDNFSLEENQEFATWNPTDWKENPSYLKEINDKALLHVGKEINKLWKILSWKCSKELKENPDRFSMIYIPNGFVIPGGRFKEIYYWDTYWIIRGLLISEMYDTVHGILKNFFYQIRKMGHVPNGTRKYYMRRSQPPYLTSMVSKYYEATGDKQILIDHLVDLETELKYFEDHRSLKYKHDGQEFLVFRYKADCVGPRPESYAEDVESAKHFKTQVEANEFYVNMMAATESGWDFSSRWIIDNYGENGSHGVKLSDVNTCFIIPVDLNSLMYKNYGHMASFYRELKNEEKAKLYEKKARTVLSTICNLLWDPHENMWFDWDMKNHKRRKYFYASNFFPLWAEAYPPKLRNCLGKCAAYYLQRSGAMKYLGGIPASLFHTSQQWDHNAWPPLQHMIVAGLNKTRNYHAQNMAFKIARNYAISTISSCNKGCACQIFEKYDPIKVGSAGGGGEYEVQTGFGWTNGVLIDFITKYGDDLVNNDSYEKRKVVSTYGRGKLRYSKTQFPVEDMAVTVNMDIAQEAEAEA